MRWSSVVWISVLSCLIQFSTGCSEPEVIIEDPAIGAVSAADYINKAQMGKITENGARFLPDSVKDMGNGKYQFQDTAGKSYEVTITTDPDNEFVMSEPVPVK